MGYNEVPPPSNENYTFLPKENVQNEVTTTPNVDVSVKLQKDISEESSIANQKVDEHAKSVEKLPINTLKRKVNFVSASNLGEVSEKFLNDKNKQILQTSPLTKSNSLDESKKSHKKKFVKRSCFNCHEKGHVASCCPHKKNVSEHRLVTKDKSPNKQDNSSNSQVKQISKSLKSNIIGNDKLGLGYNKKPQSRFTSPKTDRPKSNSPKKRNFESQSHHFSTPQRNRTPQRFHNP